MTPQTAGYVRERLLNAGALDATLTPVFMKKDRPGYMLSVLASPADREALADLVFAETTTLGIRMHASQRRVLERSWQTVEIAHGSVRVKVASSGGKVKTYAPEYEDCKKLAVASGAPFKEIWQQAVHAYLLSSSDELQ